MTKFDLIVEGKSDDVLTVAPNQLELIGLEWNGESPPDVVLFGNVTLIKIGKYASSGERYCYRIASVAMYDGKLKAND